MKRRVILTRDGSSSIYEEDMRENYHSDFGALAESLFIYIESGMKYSKANPINILEIGFGTGLNALLTMNEAIKTKRKTKYYTIEKYPLSNTEWEKLNYKELSQIGNPSNFGLIHNSEWNKWQQINQFFNIYKSKTDLLDFSSPFLFDIIYFDAFSGDAQPELWTEDILRNMYNSLQEKGLLITYSVKGTVKRALKSAGFNIEIIPGPEGKRVIMRAHK